MSFQNNNPPLNIKLVTPGGKDLSLGVTTATGTNRGKITTRGHFDEAFSPTSSWFPDPSSQTTKNQDFWQKLKLSRPETDLHSNIKSTATNFLVKT